MRRAREANPAHAHPLHFPLSAYASVLARPPSLFVAVFFFWLWQLLPGPAPGGSRAKLSSRKPVQLDASLLLCLYVYVAGRSWIVTPGDRRARGATEYAPTQGVGGPFDARLPVRREYIARLCFVCVFVLSVLCSPSFLFWLPSRASCTQDRVPC